MGRLMPCAKEEQERAIQDDLYDALRAVESYGLSGSEDQVLRLAEAARLVADLANGMAAQEDPQDSIQDP